MGLYHVSIFTSTSPQVSMLSVRLMLFTDSLKESELPLRFPRLQTRDQPVPIPVPSPIWTPRLDYQHRVRLRACWNESQHRGVLRVQGSRRLTYKAGSC